MSEPVTVVLTVLGALLVAAALSDVFRTLWQPSGEGPLSRWTSATVWRASGRAPDRVLGAAGPLIMVVVIAAWASMVVVGFALVYLPWVADDGFVYGSGLDRADRAAAVDALYLSMVVLSTLGLGDIVPSDGWLRLVTASEALIGFSLLTAGISWISQVQQALVRRRSTARFLTALRRADGDARPEPGVALLEQLAHGLAEVQVDLSQSTMSYYFRERDPHASLATALPWAAELARRGRRSDDARVRQGAAVLDVAIDDLVGMLAERFVRGSAEDREAVLAAFRAAHRHAP